MCFYNKLHDRADFYTIRPSRAGTNHSNLCRLHDGAGLGLSIVKWIVDTHNGTIEVESKPDEGSTFKILIPLLKENVESQKSTTEVIHYQSTAPYAVTDNDVSITS